MADSFENIKVWKDSRSLVKEVLRTSRRGPLSRDFALRNQIDRAALSIMANIAEGFERDGNKELVQFLSIAKGSAGELRSHLIVAYDLEVIEKEDFENLYQNSKIISSQLSGFMSYLKSSGYKGRKFGKS